MMFGRVIELMLGCWLILSPFIFRHPDGARAWWVTDLACGTAALLLALLSYWRPLRYAHLSTLLLGGWLAAHAWLAAGQDAAPALQNEIIVGLLLMMFALVPNQADLPPQRWRDYYARRARGEP